MTEVALITSSATGEDGLLAVVVDILTGTQMGCLKNCASMPGATALIAGDYVVSAQLHSLGLVARRKREVLWPYGHGASPLAVKGTAIHFWSWGAEQPKLKCHAPEKLGPLAVSGDGAFCAAGGLSGRVYFWEVSSGTLLRTWEAHYKSVSALTFSPDDSFLYTGGKDAMLSSWNVLDVADPDEGHDLFKGAGGAHSSLSALWTASEHSLPITCVHAPLGGGLVYTCSLDRSAKAWDAFSGKLVLSVTCPDFLQAVTTDPAEAFLFVGGAGGVIYQIDISATAIAATASHAALATSCEVFGVTREHSGEDRSWGLRVPEGGSGSGSGRSGAPRGERQELHGHEKAVTWLSVTSDSSILVSASEDGTARTWHVASRQCLRKTEVPGKGAASQVLLLPFPEALRMVSTSGGIGRNKLPVPLAAFDKFVRTATKSKSGTGGIADFLGGCTPVVLRGRRQGPAHGGMAEVLVSKRRSERGGVRAVLEALERFGGTGSDPGFDGDMVGVQKRGLGEAGEEAEGEEEEEEGRERTRAEKVRKLEEEVAMLRDENRRWQKVNNALFEKLRGDQRA